MVRPDTLLRRRDPLLLRRLVGHLQRRVLPASHAVLQQCHRDVSGRRLVAPFMVDEELFLPSGTLCDQHRDYFVDLHVDPPPSLAVLHDHDHVLVGL